MGFAALSPSYGPLPDTPSGREPRGALLAEQLARRRLIPGDIIGRQDVAPAAVGALVDEYLGAAVPDRAAERGAFGRVGLHPVEAAISTIVGKRTSSTGMSRNPA